MTNRALKEDLVKAEKELTAIMDSLAEKYKEFDFEVDIETRFKLMGKSMNIFKITSILRR